ncbi:hypothetical protein [Xylanibacillus composti]|uniref:Uncharacterized protein n=1 Tax=Xylanibacillus composti TaxID=1572762 RepID=A0A8J4H303_9BACL|nr:hypothetical protein [Xylanibacillus composti]GIQ69929.1 hypothetical protein XYCOK13_27530 [Xylanibacillus composti]
MATSRQHQEAHGNGQIEEQLEKQAQAAVRMQGSSETDEAIQHAADREHTELDEIYEP